MPGTEPPGNDGNWSPGNGFLGNGRRIPPIAQPLVVGFGADWGANHGIDGPQLLGAGPSTMSAMIGEGTGITIAVFEDDPEAVEAALRRGRERQAWGNVPISPIGGGGGGGGMTGVGGGGGGGYEQSTEPWGEFIPIGQGGGGGGTPIYEGNNLIGHYVGKGPVSSQQGGPLGQHVADAYGLNGIGGYYAGQFHRAGASRAVQEIAGRWFMGSVVTDAAISLATGGLGKVGKLITSGRAWNWISRLATRAKYSKLGSRLAQSRLGRYLARGARGRRARNWESDDLARRKHNKHANGIAPPKGHTPDMPEFAGHYEAYRDTARWITSQVTGLGTVRDRTLYYERRRGYLVFTQDKKITNMFNPNLDWEYVANQIWGPLN